MRNIQLNEELFRQLVSQSPPLSPAEIDHERGELSLMNDRVFAATFGDNKHNEIITGTVNAARKIHAVPPIPPIEHTQVQDIDLFDVFMRGMIGDLTGTGDSVSIAVELQNQKQDGYAVRGIITTGNAMRRDFKKGSDYTQAPDVITLHFLNFKLPELAERKMFCSRIINAEFESGTPFLADKYSTYFIELPKMVDFKKADLPQEYHDLWDLCCMFRSRVKKFEEEIKVQEITNPTALELANAVQQAVAPSTFVDEEARYRRAFEKFQDYMDEKERRRDEKERRMIEKFQDHIEEKERRRAEKERQMIEEFQESERRRAEKERQKNEEILTIALKNNAPQSLIKAMCEMTGITESRLAELKQLAQT